MKSPTGATDPERPESEILFEQYLNANGFTDYQFEKEHEGKNKKPDYSLTYCGQEILFEVKEFRATREDFRLGFGQYDPYGAIREKIGLGRKKFHEFKNSCCSLVLYNREKPLVDLGWQYIYGAMLGNLGFRMPLDLINPSQKPAEEIKPAFLGGGKMRRIRGSAETDVYREEIANQTISAVVVLDQLAIGHQRFKIEMRSKESILGRRLSFEEHEEMLELAPERSGTFLSGYFGSLYMKILNAKIPFPEQLFRGPYDERYGHSGDSVGCNWVGDEIKELDEGSHTTG